MSYMTSMLPRWKGHMQQTLSDARSAHQLNINALLSKVPQRIHMNIDLLLKRELLCFQMYDC